MKLKQIVFGLALIGMGTGFCSSEINESEMCKKFKERCTKIEASIFPQGQFVCSVESLKKRLGKDKKGSFVFDTIDNDKEKVIVLKWQFSERVFPLLTGLYLDTVFLRSQASDANYDASKKQVDELIEKVGKALTKARYEVLLTSYQ